MPCPISSHRKRGHGDERIKRTGKKNSATSAMALPLFITVKVELILSRTSRNPALKNPTFPNHMFYPLLASSGSKIRQVVATFQSLDGWRFTGFVAYSGRECRRRPAPPCRRLFALTPNSDSSRLVLMLAIQSSVTRQTQWVLFRKSCHERGSADGRNKKPARCL